MDPSLGWLGEFIHHHGLWLGLGAAFLGGLALNLTPCVYPMIPVTLAFFTGQASGALRRMVLLAAGYVAGLSLTYAALGFVAAKTGALLGSWLQRPAVLLGVAAILVALALSMFGLYELRPPQALTRRFGQAQAGLPGAIVMGMVVGVIAAPCIGPFVLGLLLLVGQLADPVAGFLLFLMLGLGMGLPYLALGVAANRLGRLPKSGVWLVWIKRALGVVLLGLAVYFVQPLLTAAGLWPAPRAAHIKTWQPYSEAAFEQARREGRPILIDIYADWCIPCVEMDHTTFRHPDVVRALSSVTPLRLDVTRAVPPEGQTLIDRHRIFGAPTVLFFDRQGRERKELRLSEFLGPKQFLKRLEQVLSDG